MPQQSVPCKACNDAPRAATATASAATTAAATAAATAVTLKLEVRDGRAGVKAVQAAVVKGQSKLLESLAVDAHTASECACCAEVCVACGPFGTGSDLTICPPVHTLSS
jgi:hypothetical protein